MAELTKRTKALSVSPLKASQTMGAALAFLGFSRSMPIMHGSQGCTAFAKVFFVRHFREPVPLQTTAMDQVSSVMGADDNIVEALSAVCEKNKPSIIGLVTTGLAETQGADINAGVKAFRKRHPEHDGSAVVAVNSPDFSGCFESGFANALNAIIETLVPKSFGVEGEQVYESRVGLRPKQVNVLCHGNLTPGDLEFIVDSIESFGLRPMLIPNLYDSLDGHLSDEGYNPLTTGGLAVDDLKTAGESVATMVIGESLAQAGRTMFDKTGVPSYSFEHLMTLEAVDSWFETLRVISGKGVAPKWVKHRRQLQDAMLDTHFMIGATKFAMASDPDLVLGFEALLSSMGSELVAAVIPTKSKSVRKLKVGTVQIGDLEDLEILARDTQVQFLIGNSHAVDSAERLSIPMMRAGFPQYDYLGGFQRCWSGYRGIQQAIFDFANLLLDHHSDAQPYHSVYSQKPEAKARYKDLELFKHIGEREPNCWGGH